MPVPVVKKPNPVGGRMCEQLMALRVKSNAAPWRSNNAILPIAVQSLANFPADGTVSHAEGFSGTAHLSRRAAIKARAHFQRRKGRLAWSIISFYFFSQVWCDFYRFRTYAVLLLHWINRNRIRERSQSHEHTKPRYGQGPDINGFFGHF